MTLYGRPLQFATEHGTTTARGSRRFLGRCSCGLPVSVLAPMLRPDPSRPSFALQVLGDNYATWRQVVDCACGKVVSLRPVKGTRNETPCDHRCTSATGVKCECSCGGANHGADHQH